MTLHPEDPDAFRASRNEREHAIELIKAAFAEGKITKDDLEIRVGRALTLLFGADVAALTADLRPAPVAVPPESLSLDRQARDALASGLVSVLWLPLMVVMLVVPIPIRSLLFLLLSSMIVVPLSGLTAITRGFSARTRLVRDGGTGAEVALGGMLAGWAGMALFVIVLALFFTR